MLLNLYEIVQLPLLLFSLWNLSQHKFYKSLVVIELSCNFQASQITCLTKENILLIYPHFIFIKNCVGKKVRIQAMEAMAT